MSISLICHPLYLSYFNPIIGNSNSNFGLSQIIKLQFLVKIIPTESNNQKRKTTKKPKTLNPIWNETLELIVSPADFEKRLLVGIWDWDSVG